MKIERFKRWAVTGLAPVIVATVLTGPVLAAEDAPGNKGDTFVVGVDGLLSATDREQLAGSSSAFGDFTVSTQLAQISADDNNDPLESMNRVVFGFNQVFYDSILGPTAKAYDLLPTPVRTVIGNLLANLSAPVVFVNDVLQGEADRALTTLLRFGMNSTVGLGGMVDVAASAGYDGHDEDFGQTLAVWGAGEGFYLVLPFLGPSDARDAIGQLGVDRAIDPFNIYLDNTDQDEWIYVRAGTTLVHQYAQIRGELDNLKRTSVDYYAAVRSLYRQRRAAEIANGNPSDLPSIPDFDLGSDDWNVDQSASSTPAKAAQGQDVSMLTGVSAPSKKPISDDYYVVAPRKPVPEQKVASVPAL